MFLCEWAQSSSTFHIKQCLCFWSFQLYLIPFTHRSGICFTSYAGKISDPKPFSSLPTRPYRRIMTRHMLNHLSYPNETPIEYRHPSRLAIVPPNSHDRFAPARTNPRADPMTRQPSRAVPAQHPIANSAAGTPRRRIPVAVCPPPPLGIANPLPLPKWVVDCFLFYKSFYLVFLEL